MKLTESQLRSIIRKELMKEMRFDSKAYALHGHEGHKEEVAQRRSSTRNRCWFCSWTTCYSNKTSYEQIN